MHSRSKGLNALVVRVKTVRRIAF